MELVDVIKHLGFDGRSGRLQTFLLLNLLQQIRKQKLAPYMMMNFQKIVF